MRRGVATGIALLALATSTGARAEATNVIAGPGSFATARFTSPVTLAQVGDVPLLVNADLALHSVESLLPGADDRAWCGPIDPSRPEGSGNPRRYPLGACPLFWSETIASRSSAPVLGLESVHAGNTYAFRCATFRDMRGLVIVA